MTDKKKSFLLYLDTLEILKKLTDEQAGKLLKAFLAYHSDQDLDLDPMLDLVFFSFKAQFERDSIKYKNIVERNKNNGSKGGRPKNPVEPKEPSGLSGNPSKPKKADSDSGNESDSDNKVNIHQQIADSWNEKFNGELSLVSKVTQKRKSAINGCIKEMKGTTHDFSKLETWTNLFDYAKKLDFLMGRNKRGWSMDFDFIITKSKLLKLIEGGYEYDSE